MRDFVPVRRVWKEVAPRPGLTSPVTLRERRPAASRPVGEGSGRIANAGRLTFSAASSLCHSERSEESRLLPLCCSRGRLLERERSLSRWLRCGRRLRHVAIGDREAVALADAIED